MSVYSDHDLSDLYPEYRGTIGPASIDLHVGSALFAWPQDVARDPRTDQSDAWRSVPLRYGQFGGDPVPPHWVLEPGVRYLAATRERVRIPDDAAGQIGARSSWGRDGLAVIQGPAGWLDPGYVGNPTLELSVVGSHLVLWPGAAICQLILFRLTSPCVTPYRGKYREDADPTPSRLHLEHVRHEVPA